MTPNDLEHYKVRGISYVFLLAFMIPKFQSVLRDSWPFSNYRPMLNRCTVRSLDPIVTHFYSAPSTFRLALQTPLRHRTNRPTLNDLKSSKVKNCLYNLHKPFTHPEATNFHLIRSAIRSAISHSHDNFNVARSQC